MTSKYPTLQERAEAKRHLPWTEAVPAPEWLQPDYEAIARPFQLIYKALIGAGFAIDYHKDVSLPGVVYLWGLYSGDQKGYIVYNVELDRYFVIGIDHPDPRPAIPGEVEWRDRVFTDSIPVTLTALQ
jgi:hypothetical protein